MKRKSRTHVYLEIRGGVLVSMRAPKHVLVHVTDWDSEGVGEDGKYVMRDDRVSEAGAVKPKPVEPVISPLAAALARKCSHFASSSGLTVEFTEFAKLWKNAIGSFLRERYGADNIQWNVGHFEISCFFMVERQWYYMNTGDVRNDCTPSMLLRTTSGPEDYTGGRNQWVSVTSADKFIQNMDLIINLRRG